MITQESFGRTDGWQGDGGGGWHKIEQTPKWNTDFCVKHGGGEVLFLNSGQWKVRWTPASKKLYTDSDWHLHTHSDTCACTYECILFLFPSSPRFKISPVLGSMFSYFKRIHWYSFIQVIWSINNSFIPQSTPIYCVHSAGLDRVEGTKETDTKQPVLSMPAHEKAITHPTTNWRWLKVPRMNTSSGISIADSGGSM